MTMDISCFRAKIEKTESCWNWNGYKRRGYGTFFIKGKPISAHRLSYELLVGPIPKGKDLHHSCRNKSCVNPAHLKPVTPKEHIRLDDCMARRNLEKTHCPRGHPLTGDNLAPFRLKIGKRICLICNRQRDLEAYYRRKNQ